MSTNDICHCNRKECSGFCAEKYLCLPEYLASREPALLKCHHCKLGERKSYCDECAEENRK